MTECSSIDSEVCSDQLQSQRKRKKFETSSCNLDMTFDESLPVEPLKGLSDGHRERPQVSKSHQSRKNPNIDIETKFQRNSSSINEVLGQKRRGSSSITSNSDKDRMAEWKYLDEDFGTEILHGSGTLDMMFDESLSVEPLNGLSDGLKEKPQIRRSYQPRTTFNVDNENQFQRRSCSINEGLGKNRGGNISMTSSSDKNGVVQCNYLDEEFITDVLDRSGTFRDGKHHFVPGNTSFLQAPELLNEPAVRSSLPAMGTHSRTFPTSAEISRDMNKCASPKDRNQIMDQQMFGRAALGSKRDDSFAKCNEEYMKENFVQEGIRNAFGISSQEKPSPLYGKNPFLNATKLSGKQGPSRTIEFIQRMKEKSRTHQQTLPCNTCLSCPGSLNNKNISKKKSPSIIDSFRYQGVSQTNKIVKPKWRKGASANSSAEKRKDSSIISPTWTPIDKRARQNLSFTRNGNEKQSKLVWRSRKSPRIDDCTRKRFRDEG